MPVQLFKYRRWLPTLKRKENGTIDEVSYTGRLLLDHALYCQNPRDFDDPHDSHTGAIATGSIHDIDRFVIENMAPVIQAMKTSRLTSLTQLATCKTPEAAAALTHLEGINRRRELRILCLSAVGNEERMWAFYADYHRGICLEFDGRHPRFSMATAVRYASSPPSPPAIPTNPGLDPLAFTKAKAWSFQKEWRITTDAPTYSFPPGALRRIILGYRFPEHQFEQLTKTLISGNYRVVIDQMQRKPKSYALIPVRRSEIAPR